ncbi:hypothetical protein TNCT_166551 [Trichonephila clavata]|uniref:Uncharacterized protein n=1 Tax=Trichonephila clavata TaxID=2740835 RepID=A0A8X6I5D1_TRICU|nr:hypothetical protein TNCT_166551 [Trichonephila clavata]
MSASGQEAGRHTEYKPSEEAQGSLCRRHSSLQNPKAEETLKEARGFITEGCWGSRERHQTEVLTQVIYNAIHRSSEEIAS